MIDRINGQLVFCYNCRKNKKRQLFYRFYITSLLVILMGIFLLPKVAYLSDITPEKLIELTNEERLRAGLNALTANQLLTKAAINKAGAILESQTFKHTIDNKIFSSWIRETGYNYSYVGENLAIDFITSEGIIQAWDNSSFHKKNLLSPYYQEIGIAALEGKFQNQNSIIVVQIFGTPPQIYAKTFAADKSIGFFNPAGQGQELETNKLYNYQSSENLLTNSINPILLPQVENKISFTSNFAYNNKLNNIFEQLSYWLSYYYLINIFFSLLLILLTSYFFYFYLIKIYKLSRIKI